MGGCCSSRTGNPVLFGGTNGRSELVSPEKLRQTITDFELPDWPSLIKRKWQSVSDVQTGCSITVLSFNVLADSKQGDEEWTTPPAVFVWEKRKWRLLEEVLANGLADVVSIQECDHFEDFWLPSMRGLGYEGMLQREPQPAGHTGDMDGVALFWRTARLDKLQEYPVTFEDPHCITKGVALVCRMKLNHIAKDESPQELILATAHLMPGKTTKDEQGRALQAIKMLDVAVGAGVGAGLPAIVMGDYNAQPHQDSKIGDPLAYSATLKHSGLALSSAYADALGEEPECTTWKRRPKSEIKRTIDYIFHTKELKTTQILKIPEREDMSEALTPSFEYGSDHFALGASFALG